MQNRLGLLALFLGLFLSSVRAQVPSDTLHLTLDSAEKLFLTQNYQLLAQRYNIDVQKAQILQARLYSNPNLSMAYSLYNPETKTFFPTGSGPNGGNFAAELSQLVYLAGKRNKQVKIAEQNATLAEYQFYDLIRTLKYTLRTDFYNIYYLRNSEKVYNEEVNSLQDVVRAFSEQVDKGYISVKELVRVKAQLYTLLGEYNSLQNQVNDLESELRLILQVRNVAIDPVVDSGAIASLNPTAYPINTLLDSAVNNRTDLKIARANTQLSRLDYNYQKALAVPDVTLALAYDQQGSYVNNFNSIGASIDLPFFNRNQGNIKSAKSAIDQSLASEKSAEATVQENVFRSLQKAYTNDKLLKGIDTSFKENFSQLLHEVLINYKKRNLTLLEFLDFYDSFKQNVLQMNQVQMDRVSAFEELNFYTGTNFFNK